MFQSLDAGSSWKDITSTLPLRFTQFNEIVFAVSTVYIATDTGVLASQTGEHWRVLTRKIVMDRLAVDGTTVYGAADTGVYRLDGLDEWEPITHAVPDKVVSLVVDMDKLHIATRQHGIFFITREAEDYDLSRRLGGGQ